MEHHLAKVGVAGSIPVSRSEGGSRIAIRWFGAFLRIYMKPRKNKKLTARKLACRGKAAFLFLCGECRDEIESRSDSMSGVASCIYACARGRMPLSSLMRIKRNYGIIVSKHAGSPGLMVEFKACKMKGEDTMEMKDRIQIVTCDIMRDYLKNRDVDKMDVFAMPDREIVKDILKKLFIILYPGYNRERNFRVYRYDTRVSLLIEDISFNLQKQIVTALRLRPEYADVDEKTVNNKADDLVVKFFEQIPKIREYLDTDLQAFYEGDPAAFNKQEIVLCYPGFMAISTNRIAHELFLLGIPLIPRIMTEYAHSNTGIDIHPGATIGKYFFMDHGTGIVVGETSIIGEHVKVYQGVTIGALSTRGGQSLKGKKRHPTIEDNVTIYAGASILGGDTVIGAGSVIGSNVFITSSVKSDSRISVKTQELLIKRHGEILEVDRREETKSDNGNKQDTWFYII